MYIYTESGGNSGGNERKISYFPGSIKKKKTKKKERKKGYRGITISNAIPWASALDGPFDLSNSRNDAATP